MTHLRNIVFDLVEKRLWPVAVALVVAIVAVPLALRTDPAPAPPIPPAAAGAAPAAQLAAAATDEPGGPLRLGSLRDPFGRDRRPAADDSASAAAAPAARTAAAARDPFSGAGGGAAATPGGSGENGLPAVGGAVPKVDLLPLPDGGRAPATAGPDVVTVRIGRAGRLELRRDVAVRAPLPSVGDPFLVYLGNKPDGRSAQFLVSGDADPSGEGGCRPSPELCEEIVLRAGMTAFFDIEGRDGRVVQHQLDVVRVGRG